MLKLYVNQELNHIKPLLGSEDSLMVGDRVALPQNISKKSGQLYTWGRGSEGQLGQNAYRYPPNCCALPRPVKGLHNIIQVSCGGGVQGCTAAITITGKVFTFGNNFKDCLRLQGACTLGLLGAQLFVPYLARVSRSWTETL